MVGDEPMCDMCDNANGWDLDPNMRTCFERLHANPEPWLEECSMTDPLMEGCSVCAAIEKVDHNNAIQIHQYCRVCHAGHMMTNKGHCVEMWQIMGAPDCTPD
jgi:hypothetical protein